MLMKLQNYYGKMAHSSLNVIYLQAHIFYGNNVFYVFP